MSRLKGQVLRSRHKCKSWFHSYSAVALWGCYATSLALSFPHLQNGNYSQKNGQELPGVQSRPRPCCLPQLYKARAPVRPNLGLSLPLVTLACSQSS